MISLARLTVALVFIAGSGTPLDANAELILCHVDSKKGNGYGWIPDSFSIDVTPDKQLATVVKPSNEVFGASPFKKTFLVHHCRLMESMAIVSNCIWAQ